MVKVLDQELSYGGRFNGWDLKYESADDTVMIRQS
jgi:hypothetical protein